MVSGLFSSPAVGNMLALPSQVVAMSMGDKKSLRMVAAIRATCHARHIAAPLLAGASVYSRPHRDIAHAGTITATSKNGATLAHAAPPVNLSSPAKGRSGTKWGEAAFFGGEVVREAKN